MRTPSISTLLKRTMALDYDLRIVASKRTCMGTVLADRTADKLKDAASYTAKALAILNGLAARD